MKIHYKTRSGRIVAEIEGGDAAALFEALANFQEVFESDSRCGCCQSEDIIFRVRDVDKNKFYELSCRACRARLSFGQHKAGGTLWAKRKDARKKPLPDRGWSVYQNGAEAA